MIAMPMMPKTSTTPLRVRGLLRAGAALLRSWRARMEERAFLETLSERELRDIGLTRGDRRYEVDKPFWRA
jgi:uncharacterized protein YjiS (DUF1127 family)